SGFPSTSSDTSLRACPRRSCRRPRSSGGWPAPACADGSVGLVGRLLRRPVLVLIAPDSFKGSLTSVQVSRALAEGWSLGRPDDSVVLCPLADGGEGTLEAIAAAGGWTWLETTVTDPLGRQIRARWLASDDGTHAAVEMAEASGLSRVATGERDAIRASSLGTGELLRAAIDAGATSLVLGIGGSATTDGGAGLLRGLGAVAD